MAWPSDTVVPLCHQKMPCNSPQCLADTVLHSHPGLWEYKMGCLLHCTTLGHYCSCTWVQASRAYLAGCQLA